LKPGWTLIDPWNDKNLQGDQDQIFMDLDIELDLLPGITANMMRLERFSAWYTDGLGSESKYQRELERISKTRSTSSYNYNKPKYIRMRYATMLSFNPGSLFHRYEASKSWDMTTRLFASTNVRTIQEAFDLGSIKEEWDRDKWHNGCYRSDIPPFDSEEVLIKLWTGLNRDVSKKSEQEFNGKLMGWVGDGDGQCFNSLDIGKE
jgi:hypothetical protein